MGTIGRAAMIVLAAIALAFLPGAAAAQDDDGLDEVGTTTWVVDPSGNEATATIDLSLRNTVPETSTRRTYFDGYGISLPMPPTEVGVRTGGSDVPTEVATLDDGTTVLSWDFPRQLFHDQVVDFQVVATFASAAPRTPLRQGPRVTEAFVMVPIWAWGRDDAELEVRVPADMGARLGFADPDRTDGDVAVFLRRDAGEFSELLVGASDAGQRSTDEITVGAATVVIESWPEDPEWGRRIADFASTALPRLAAWTGTDWQDDRLTIRETARPIAEGWGGWNDPRANTIAVGEEFDRALWTHELAHNWIDGEQFSDTWLLEGLTEEITESLSQDLDIGSPPIPEATDRPLLRWWDILATAQGDLLDDPDGWYEITGELYAGAHHVVDAVADEVGEEAFREVVRMTLQDESVWGDLGHDPDPAADWREFLDLSERVGGSTLARDLVLTHVRPGSEKLLGQRDTAIEAFDELAEHPWGAPHAVAASMHAWRFRVVLDQIAQARAARDGVEALAARADRRGWAIPDLKRAWQARPPEDVTARVAALEAVLDDVEELESQASDADLPAPALALDPAVDDPQEMTRRVDALSTSISRVVQAERAVDEVANDGIATVGLAGTDLGELQDRARDALAAGDVPAVTRAVDDLTDVVDGAARRGRLRLGVVVVGILAVLLGAGGGFLRSRRRRLAADDWTAGSS